MKALRSFETAENTQQMQQCRYLEHFISQAASCQNGEEINFRSLSDRITTSWWIQTRLNT
jgi:hypothetical protein